MESTNINNGTDPTMANQTTVEMTERNRYKIPILLDRETDLSKNQPQNVVGTDIRIYRPEISEEIRRIDRTGN